MFLDMLLPLSQRREGKWNKKFACLYCDKQVSKFARHIEQRHSSEPEVANLLATTVKKTTKKGKCEDRKREEGYTSMRRRAAYKFNLKVLGGGLDKPLQLERRSGTTKYRFADYRPCPVCLGFFQKKNLVGHVKKCCPNRPDVLKESTALLSAMSGECSPEDLKPVLSSMADDEVSRHAKSDPLIMAYGSQLFERYEYKKVSVVSAKMREIARLTLTAKGAANSQINSAMDLIHPKAFDHVIAAVKELCNMKPGKKTESTPSLALKLGPLLKKMASILKNKAIRDEDALMEERTNRYLFLHGEEWGDRITRYSLDAVVEKKKSPSLPITQDLQVNLHRCVVHCFVVHATACCTTVIQNQRHQSTTYGNVQRYTSPSHFCRRSESI